MSFSQPAALGQLAGRQHGNSLATTSLIWLTASGSRAVRAMALTCRATTAASGAAPVLAHFVEIAAQPVGDAAGGQHARRFRQSREFHAPFPTPVAKSVPAASSSVDIGAHRLAQHFAASSITRAAVTAVGGLRRARAISAACALLTIWG